MQSLSNITRLNDSPTGFTMSSHENNRILLTKQEFRAYLHEAVCALGHLTRSWYAASTSLMPTSDKEILEITFEAWDSLSTLEHEIAGGIHDDYFARAAKIGADNVGRFHAVSGV
jgi:hypothetical protein